MERPLDDLVPLHEPFETALRGFNRQQVLAHIESLDGRISMLSADRESALAQVAELSRTLDHLRRESALLAHLHQEIKKANEQVERIHQSPIVGAGARIQRIVQLAEEEAAELKARAEQEAAELKARAQREAAELKARAQREAAELKARAEQEAAELKARARRESEQENARRESEASARIRNRDQSSIAGLYLMLRIVGPQLAERVSAAERQEARITRVHVETSRQVSELEAVRAAITAQLATTREVLARALEQVQPAKADPPRLPQPVPIQRGRIVPAAQVAESPTVQLRPDRADEGSFPG